MQLPPGKPQFVRRPIHQFANLAVHLGMPAPPGRLVRAPPRPGTRDGPPECGRAKRRRLAVSYARRLGDAVDPAALLCGGSEGEAELLLQSPREDAAHRMALPTRGARHFVDRCPLGLSQHRNDLILLQWALRVAFWVWKGLDRRPQLIDQRIPVADFSPLFDTGQSIRQCQQLPAIERGGVQFLIRSDDDLALIECRRRLAGQRDSVIADDIDTHGWGLLIGRTAGAAGDPHSRSLRRPKPVYSGQPYGIIRPGPSMQRLSRSSATCGRLRNR